MRAKSVAEMRANKSAISPYALNDLKRPSTSLEKMTISQAPLHPSPAFFGDIDMLRLRDAAQALLQEESINGCLTRDRYGRLVDAARYNVTDLNPSRVRLAPEAFSTPTNDKVHSSNSGSVDSKHQESFTNSPQLHKDCNNDRDTIPLSSDFGTNASLQVSTEDINEDTRSLSKQVINPFSFSFLFQYDLYIYMGK